MAQYRQREVTPGDLENELANALGVACDSIEVVSNGDNYLVRMWFGEHCNIEDHEEI